MIIYIKSLIQPVIISFISGGLTALIFNYFFNKKLDRYQRLMGVRKEIYSDVQEKLAGFFSTATEDMRQESYATYLSLYRQILLWASEDVVKQFNRFLETLDKKNGKTQDEINDEYINLVITLRKDLVGKKISKKEIRLYGKIT